MFCSIPRRIGLGFPAHLFVGSIAHLIALIEQVDLRHPSNASLSAALASSSWIFRSWAERLRLSRRCIAALRVSRVREMTRIMNAGTILLDLDVALEIAADALELADHFLDLADPATPFVDLTNECLA